MVTKTCIKTLVWMLIVLMAAPPGLFAQESGAPPPLFRQEELHQMLAPIALYPDSLLVQVLMAATYPVEVVQANRWTKANQGLTGEQFAEALDQQDWDPSVKSLVNFPSVLTMMDENLSWTQRLGDAFLSQKDQVMDTVQKLRSAAQTQGTLQNTSQQRIMTEGQTIVIETANPQVIYVPAYDPFYVYGPWWYPSYPPYRYYPRGAVFAGPAISFGLGVAVGLAWGYAWGGFGWNRHEVFVNTQRNIHVNTYINRSRSVYVNRIGGGGRGEWRHDPVHRKGVAYRNESMARQFGQAPRGNPDARRVYRGYAPSDSRQLSQPGGRPQAAGPRDQPGVGRPGVQGAPGSAPPVTRERRDVRPPDRTGVETAPRTAPPSVQDRRDVRPPDRTGAQVAPRTAPQVTPERRDVRPPDRTGVETAPRTAPPSVQDRRDVRPPDRTGVETAPRTAPPSVQDRRDVRPPDRPAVQAPRDITPTARQQVQQAPPAGAFTGIERGGREVRINSDRGRASRESVVTPRPAAAPSSPAVTRPGGSRGSPPAGAVSAPSPSGSGSSRGGDSGRPGGGGSQRGGRH